MGRDTIIRDYDIDQHARFVPSYRQQRILGPRAALAVASNAVRDRMYIVTGMYWTVQLNTADQSLRIRPRNRSNFNKYIVPFILPDAICHGKGFVLSVPFLPMKVRLG